MKPARFFAVVLSLSCALTLSAQVDSWKEDAALDHTTTSREVGIGTTAPTYRIGIGTLSRSQALHACSVPRSSNVRVDATTSPTLIGDLLVSGSKPGMAMKSQPTEAGGVAIHRPGTVIGKALEPLNGTSARFSCCFRCNNQPMARSRL